MEQVLPAIIQAEEEKKQEEEDEGEEEELEDIPAAEKDIDPLRKAMVKRTIDGVPFLGQVEDIEVGMRTRERLYRIRYTDGELEHLIAEQVKEMQVCNEPCHVGGAGVNDSVGKEAAEAKKVEDAAEGATMEKPATKKEAMRKVSAKPETDRKVKTGDLAKVEPFAGAEQQAKDISVDDEPVLEYPIGRVQDIVMEDVLEKKRKPKVAATAKLQCTEPAKVAVKGKTKGAAELAAKTKARTAVAVKGVVKKPAAANTKPKAKNVVAKRPAGRR